ncbi:MAG TPA: hypothetical protein VND93_06485 [Myxococcales bacterium]|nr:hypothetical protein [Myxococcales bacterium]
MAKTLPPKLGGQPPPPTGATREKALSSPSLPAVKPAAAQPPPADPKAQKKKLKDVDWSQKAYFGEDGISEGGQVSTPQQQAPRRGRTLVIPAVQEQPQPQAEASPENAWAEAEAPSAQDARESRDAREAKQAKEAKEGKDAKGAAARQALGSSPLQRVTQKLAMQPPPLPGAAKAKGTLYELLENAKEPGVLYTEDDEREGGRGEEEDPELAEAVEECIRLLFGVRGIHHIGPGTNDQGETVIVVAAGQGFGEESMRRVPERVGRFKTLVALPFDLLPLRRAAR